MSWHLPMSMMCCDASRTKLCCDAGRAAGGDRHAAAAAARSGDPAVRPSQVPRLRVHPEPVLPRGLRLPQLGLPLLVRHSEPAIRHQCLRIAEPLGSACRKSRIFSWAVASLCFLSCTLCLHLPLRRPEPVCTFSLSATTMCRCVNWRSAPPRAQDATAVRVCVQSPAEPVPSTLCRHQQRGARCLFYLHDPMSFALIIVHPGTL